jgi:hypothetical protein
VAGAAQAAEAIRVEVLDHLVLPETRVDGLKVGEVSGIEWSVADDLLYAVSDKAILLSFRLVHDGSRLVEVAPVAAVRLRDAEGGEIDDEVFNPEGLEIAPSDGATRLLVVSEAGPAAAIFDAEGAWVEGVPVPEAVADPALQSSEADGLESVALHPVLGLLTAPEEPLAAADRRTHTIFAEDGATFSYSTADLDNTSLKAMRVLEDGRLLILERARSDADELIPYLRVLDPSSCGADGLCATAAARLGVPGITDADFEGLADLGGGLMLIASDDKVDGDLRTVFALVRLDLS